MLVLIKLIELAWIISKKLIHNDVYNTKYYFHCILSWCNINIYSKNSSDNTTKPKKVYKSSKSIRDKVN